MRPPFDSMSMRTGTVRTANSVSSCDPTSRSDDAGGAATSDGASARGGAGMNDDGRGLFSAVDSHAATGVPFEVTRVRERRRFFSSAFGALTAFGRAAAGGGGAGTGPGADCGAAFNAAGLAAAFGADADVAAG